MRQALIAGMGLALSASAGYAQTNGRFEFEFDPGIVSPSNPSVTVRVFAAWDQMNLGDFLFTSGNYDLVASSGEFTTAMLLLGIKPAGTAGILNGNRIDMAAMGQVHLPGTIGILGDPANPIALAEYTWTTTDFTPRTVAFHTEDTNRFAVTPSPGGPSTQLFPGQFTPGSGSITVVPGPAAALVLVGSGLIAVRRRRM